jgi:LL-diaminopimelate aminotransferase
MVRIASRLESLPPYIFVQINARLKELQATGSDVIRLDMGSPDLPPPDIVIEKLHESARLAQNHGYSGYRGTSAFRAAVARYYRRRFDVAVDPDTEVLPLLGSKEGIVNLTLALVDRGDTTLVPELGYPAYSMGTLLAGGTVFYVPMDHDNEYHLRFEMIPAETCVRSKLLWINYPNNPTGAVTDHDRLQEIVAFGRRHGIVVASDNPYMDVTYDGYQAPSLLQVSDEDDLAVEYMSFSKTFNMAGWRLGAVVGSADVINALLNVKSNIDSGHFTAVYDAGISALDKVPREWIDQRNARYQERRDRIVAALPACGLTGCVPKGAMYVWARPLEGDGASYVRRALEEAFVSLTPGLAYGPAGNDYVRFSISVDDARLDEALHRLQSLAGY